MSVRELGPATSSRAWPARAAARDTKEGEPSALQALPAFTWLPVAALAAPLALALAAPGAAARVAVPVAVGGALLGVPHGAVDHVLPWWWGAGGGHRIPVLVTVGYAAAAAAGTLAFWRAPTAGFAAALLLSAVHFGRAEVAAWAERAGRPTPAARTDLLPCTAHGAAVVGLLLWAHPAATDPLLRGFSPALAAGALATRAVGLVAVAALVVAGVAALLAHGRRQDAAELALVAAAFAFAPPLAAFGAYFGLWHAVRHTGRLLDFARSVTGGPDWAAAARRLARAGALPSAVALVTIAALWAAGTAAPVQVEVGVLLALTFPHTVLVWVMDRRRSVAGAPVPGGARLGG